MLLIVAGHFATQTNAIDKVTDLNQVFTYLFGSAHRIAVNLFLFLGVWFMVDQKFSAKRVARLYTTTWLYTVVFSVIAIAIDRSLFSAKTIADAIFPFTRSSLWFVTVYLQLLFLSPFIKKALGSLDRVEIRNLTILLSAFVIILSTVRGLSDTILCALVYFVYAYILVWYYKKYVIEKIKFKYLLLIAGLIAYVVLVLCKLYCDNSTVGLLHIASKVIGQWLNDYKSLPNLLISISIFTFFVKIDIGEVRGINLIASTSFGVYIIHQVPAFYNLLWFYIFKVDKWIDSTWYAVGFVGVVISVYIIGSGVELLRKKFIEPLLLNARFVNRVVVYIDSLF